MPRKRPLFRTLRNVNKLAPGGDAMKVTNVPHLRQREELRLGQRDGLSTCPWILSSHFSNAISGRTPKSSTGKSCTWRWPAAADLLSVAPRASGRPSCGPTALLPLCKRLSPRPGYPYRPRNSPQFWHEQPATHAATWPTRPQRPCRPAIRPGGVLTTPPRRFSAQAKQSWPPSATGPTPWQCRSSALVAG